MLRPSGFCSAMSLFHGVLFGVGFIVESPDVLDNEQSLDIFFWDTEDGRVVSQFGLSHHYELEHISKGLFRKLLVLRIVQELSLVNWQVVFEMQTELEFAALSQVFGTLMTFWYFLSRA